MEAMKHDVSTPASRSGYIMEAMKHDVSTPVSRSGYIMEAMKHDVSTRDVSDAEISRSADADAYANICA